MYNQNALATNSSEQYSKVVPSANYPNIEQDQNQQIHQFHNQHQIIVNQTTMLEQQLIEPDQPIYIQDQLMHTQLIQFSTPFLKKQFAKRVILINTLQNLLVIIIVYYSKGTNTFQNVFYNNNQNLYLFYIIIAVIILLLIASLFIRPPKNKCFQALAQIIMTILYLIFAIGITLILPNVYVSAYVLFHQITLVSYLIVLITKGKEIEISIVIKYMIELHILQFFLIAIILLITGGVDNITYILQFFLFLLGFFILEVAYAMLFLYSLNQLVDGKFNLRVDDYLAAAMIVLVNIFTLKCFKQK